MARAGSWLQGRSRYTVPAAPLELYGPLFGSGLVDDPPPGAEVEEVTLLVDPETGAVLDGRLAMTGEDPEDGTWLDIEITFAATAGSENPYQGKNHRCDGQALHGPPPARQNAAAKGIIHPRVKGDRVPSSGRRPLHLHPQALAVSDEFNASQFVGA